MTFSADAVDDLRALQSERGESIAWTRRGGSPVTLTALVDRQKGSQLSSRDGLTVVRKCTVQFVAADLTSGAAAVNDGPITIAGETWACVSEPATNDGCVSAELEASVRSEVSREGLRKGN
jgi:hypothetical protein